MRILWLCLCLLGGLLLASGQLRRQLQLQDVAQERADEDIATVFEVIQVYRGLYGICNFITYTGHIDLRPSLQQLLFEKYGAPLYVVGSNLGPLEHRYLKATNIIIILFTGLDDPTLAAVNDTQLGEAGSTFIFLQRPATYEEVEEWQPLTAEEMEIFFDMCRRRQFVRSMLVFKRESRYEGWTYYYLSKVMTIRNVSTPHSTFRNIIRQKNYRFLAQVYNDPPNVFWYVDEAGNPAIGGSMGIVMREFMHYMNATMDILPREGRQRSDYRIEKHSDGRIVDVAANLVDDASLSETCPVLTDSRTCLLVPHRIPEPWNNYIQRMFHPSIRLWTLGSILCYTVIKYLANPRQSLLGSFLSGLRLALGMPLPSRELANLRLPEQFIEVYSLLGMSIFISVTASVLATGLTSGIFEPAITNLASMQASSLRIMTDDPAVAQIFRENRLPSSLADRLLLVDSDTMFEHFISLNYSYAYVMRSNNWRHLSLYQQHMKVAKFRLAENELCTNTQHLRLPISPESPLRFVFTEFYKRILEPGLLPRWKQMGFDNFREMVGVKKRLPLDTSPFHPLPLAFFRNTFLVYLGGVLLSLLALIIELLKRPNRAN